MIDFKKWQLINESVLGLSTLGLGRTPTVGGLQGAFQYLDEKKKHMDGEMPEEPEGPEEPKMLKKKGKCNDDDDDMDDDDDEEDGELMKHKRGEDGEDHEDEDGTGDEEPGGVARPIGFMKKKKMKKECACDDDEEMPKKKSRMGDDDDDDDDDDEEMPKKKSRMGDDDDDDEEMPKKKSKIGDEEDGKVPLGFMKKKMKKKMKRESTEDFLSSLNTAYASPKNQMSSEKAWWNDVKSYAYDPNQKFNDGFTRYKEDYLISPPDNQDQQETIQPGPGEVGFAPSQRVGWGAEQPAVNEQRRPFKSFFN